MKIRDLLNESNIKSEYKKNYKKSMYAVVRDTVNGVDIIRDGISFDTAFYDWKNSSKKVYIAYIDKKNKLTIIPEKEYMTIG